jgi:hypothetical protein
MKTAKRGKKIRPKQLTVWRLSVGHTFVREKKEKRKKAVTLFFFYSYFNSNI